MAKQRNITLVPSGILILLLLVISCNLLGVHSSRLHREYSEEDVDRHLEGDDGYVPELPDTKDYNGHSTGNPQEQADDQVQETSPIHDYYDNYDNPSSTDPIPGALNMKPVDAAKDAGAMMKPSIQVDTNKREPFKFPDSQINKPMLPESNKTDYDYYDGDAGVGDVNSGASVDNGQTSVEPKKKKKKKRPSPNGGGGKTNNNPIDGSNKNGNNSTSPGDKNNTSIPPMMGGPMGSDSPELLRNQCVDYGLHERDFESARLIKEGCSVECKNSYSAIDVHLPNGHPCTPGMSGYSCNYGKCTRTPLTVSNKLVKLSLKILYTNLKNTYGTPMFIVARLSDERSGYRQDDMEERRRVLCMTSRTNKKEPWWFHRCQIQLVSPSSVLEFEIRTINETQPLYKGFTNLKYAKDDLIVVPLNSSMRSDRNRSVVPRTIDFFGWLGKILNPEEDHDCPKAPPCPACQECPDPSCPVCPYCEVCRECPASSCPACPSCPSCPACQVCQRCKECPLCPTRKPLVCPTQKPLVCPTHKPLVCPTHKPLVCPTHKPLVCPTLPPSTSPEPSTSTTPTPQPPRLTSYSPKLVPVDTINSPSLVIAIQYIR